MRKNSYFFADSGIAVTLLICMTSGQTALTFEPGFRLRQMTPLWKAIMFYFTDMAKILTLLSVSADVSTFLSGFFENFENF